MEPEKSGEDTRSRRQAAQEVAAVHVVFKGLAAIDEDHGYFVVILAAQFEVCIDVYLAPLEVGLALDSHKRLLDDVAEMTAWARIDHNFVHKSIVNGGT